GRGTRTPTLFFGGVSGLRAMVNVLLCKAFAINPDTRTPFLFTRISGCRPGVRVVGRRVQQIGQELRGQLDGPGVAALDPARRTDAVHAAEQGELILVHGRPSGAVQLPNQVRPEGNLEQAVLPRRPDLIAAHGLPAGLRGEALRPLDDG